MPRGRPAALALVAALVVAGCLGPGGGGGSEEASAGTSPAQGEASEPETAGKSTGGTNASDGIGTEVRVRPAYGNASPRSRMTFGTAPIGYDAFEPTLGIAPDGTVYYNAGGRILRSDDHGQHWNTTFYPEDAPAATADPYLHVDRATGRVYGQILTVACTALHWSDDGGETWMANPAACGRLVIDHQSIATGPAGLPAPSYEGRALYLCAGQRGGGGQLGTVSCSVSLDGGATFPISRSVFPLRDCTFFNGPPAVGPDGTAYVGSSPCREPWVGVSKDTGRTWTPMRVSNLSVASEGIDPQVAVDSQGGVYYAWLDGEGTPRLSVSTDQGATWGRPVPLGFRNLSAAALPTMAAGEGGTVAVAYLGTTNGTEVLANEVPESAAWDIYVAVVRNATVAQPSLGVYEATKEPVHEGPCQDGGARCMPGFVDYFDVDIGPKGRVYVSGARPSGEGIVVVQETGPSLVESREFVSPLEIE